MHLFARYRFSNIEMVLQRFFGTPLKLFNRIDLMNVDDYL